MALWITPPMLWIQTLVFPLVYALNAIGNVLLRLGRRQSPGAERPSSHYTPEELQLIVEESEERRRAPRRVRPDAAGALRLRRSDGGEAMVPRVRVTGIPLGSGAERIREHPRPQPHTRYPVYRAAISITSSACIHIKDLLRLLLATSRSVPRHARPLPLVPRPRRSTTCWRRCGASTRRWLSCSTSTAAPPASSRSRICSTKLSATSTRARATPASCRDGDGRLRVPGTVRIDEVGEAFDIDLEHEDVDSVSGLVLTLLGRPPQVGDSVRYDRLLFDVTEVKGRGVEECAVCLAP